jgi:hypothetical protein
MSVLVVVVTSGAIVQFLGGAQITSDRKRAASLRPFSVELPGIEPVLKIALNWENASFDTRNDMKQRGMTCGYTTGVDGINTREGWCFGRPCGQAANSGL